MGDPLEFGRSQDCLQGGHDRGHQVHYGVASRQILSEVEGRSSVSPSSESTVFTYSCTLLSPDDTPPEPPAQPGRT